MNDEDVLLIKQFLSRPKNNGQRIIVVLYKDDKTELNIRNVLNQSIKVSLLYLITPFSERPLTPFEKETCCIQNNGGIDMLFKEREECILIYGKFNHEVLKGSDSLKTILTLVEPSKIYNLKDMVIANNTIPICIDDLYTNKYGTYWL
jgi:hypothetical protein